MIITLEKDDGMADRRLYIYRESKDSKKLCSQSIWMYQK